MRHGLLCDELDDITHCYDYGIVPGSATVFVKDELNNIGRLDLTLLEGVMIVVEVSEEGYKVASCSPLSNVGIAIATAQIVQKNLEIPFETMDNLLMAISPMFRERFQQALYDRLESVHHSGSQPAESSSSSLNLVSQLSNTSHLTANNNNPHLHNTTSSLSISQTPATTASSSTQQLDLNHTLSQDVLDELHSWIH